MCKPFRLRDRFANLFRRHRALVNNCSDRFECFDCGFKLEPMFAVTLDYRFHSRLTTKDATRLSNWDYGAAERRLGGFQFERDLSRTAAQSWHNFHFFGSRSCIFHFFQLRAGRWCGAAKTWEVDPTTTNFEHDHPTDNPNAGQN